MKPSSLKKNATPPNSVYIGSNRLITKISVNGIDFIFKCEADDKLITPWFVTTGRYDDISTAFALNSVGEDSHCVDVGANFGYFTCLLAKFCPRGRVIGIEPDEDIHKIAVDNVLINSVHNVAEIIHGAANSTTSPMKLYRRMGRSGNTSIVSLTDDYTEKMGEPPVQSFVVQGIRVDDLLPRLKGRIDFLKIDVEGAEPLVFEGAQKSILNNPYMKILFEWSPEQIHLAGFDISAFLQEIANLGFRPFIFNKNRIHSISFDDLYGMRYQSGVLLKSNHK